jgi:anaerobic selenocysteine-containing dehydrogenase
MKRRSLLKGMAAGAMAGVAGMRAPGVLGQAKPFAGVTINGACFRWTG